MKKGLFILLFLTMSAAGFAQQDQDAVVTNEIEAVNTSKDAKSKASISAEIKAKIFQMNNKKSNEIISIKAYRKSLQIKVKTVKLC